MPDLTDMDVARIIGQMYRARRECLRQWNIATSLAFSKEERARAAIRLNAARQRLQRDAARFADSGRCGICLKPPERPHTHNTRDMHRAREFRGEDPALCPAPAAVQD